VIIDSHLPSGTAAGFPDDNTKPRP